MKYNSAKKPERCPACESEKIARILYGMPAFSEELHNKLNNKEIVLGGCCITGDDPTWKCVDCNAAIYKLAIDFNCDPVIYHHQSSREFKSQI